MIAKAPWTCQYASVGKNLQIDSHAQVSNGTDAPANNASLQDVFMLKVIYYSRS